MRDDKLLQRLPSGRYASRNLADVVSRNIKATAPTERRNNGYIIWECSCLFCKKMHGYPSYYFVRGIAFCDCDEWKDRYSGEIGRKPLPNFASHVNSKYGQYRRAARERNISFMLTKDECRKLFEGNCFYCGAKPKEHRRKHIAGVYYANGIDRMDSNIGYILENCVSCCADCNFAKSDRTVGEFASMISRIYKGMVLKGLIK